MPSFITNIILLILVIGTLTFIHELGHFIAAKLVKVKVFEFALGFGPKLISKKYKGTVYSIRILPLGGYVKILGDGDPGEEKVTKEDEKRNLSNKPKIQQIFVMLAGITMNIILAVSIYYIVLASSDWKLYLNINTDNFTPIGAEVYRQRIGDVEYIEVKEDGNAFKAGIPSAGKIMLINDQTFTYTDEMGSLLLENKNKVVKVNICSTQDAEEICRDYNVTVSEEGLLGVVTVANYWNVLSYENFKPYAGFSHLWNNLNLIVSQLGGMFKEAKDTGDYSELSNSVSGPVGMYFVIDYFKSLGLVTFLNILADLSLSLAIVNILPIPALDGGRAFILFLEGVLRKDLNKDIEALIINISFVLLMILIVLVMIKDIVNIDNLKAMFA